MTFTVRYLVKSHRILPLVNRALRSGIAFLKIREGETEILFVISREDAPSFEKILVDMGIAFHKSGFTGFRPFLRRVLSRPFLLTSVALTLVALLFFGGFVYGYSISGNDRVNRAAIAEVLRENGVTGFRAKSSIDLKKIKKDVSALEGVAFASVKVVGSRLYVDITEELPHVLPEEPLLEPIVATEDAVITNLIVESGTARVAVGDLVKKGSVLIDPVYTFTEGEASAAARGIVVGRVLHRVESVLPLYSLESLPTGRKSSVRLLSLFGNPIGEEPGSPYSDSVSSDRVLYRAAGVTVTERSFAEYRDALVYHDFDREASLVVKELTEELLLSVPFYATEVKGVSVTQKKVDNTLITVLYYTLEQRIDSSIFGP